MESQKESVFLMIWEFDDREVIGVLGDNAVVSKRKLRLSLVLLLRWRRSTFDRNLGVSIVGQNIRLFNHTTNSPRRTNQIG